MQLHFIKKLDLAGTIYRFPLPIICCLILFTTSICKIYFPNIFFSQAITDQILKYSIISGTALIANKLFAEAQNWDSLTRNLSSVSLLICIGIFCYNEKNIVPGLLLFVGFFLAIVAAPYAREDDNTNSICWFGNKILTGLLAAFSLGVFIIVSILLIFFTLDHLFKIKLVDSDLLTWMIGLELFTPIFFLSTIPKNFVLPKNEAIYPQIMVFLNQNILPIFILLYSLILHCYIANIIWLGELPKGTLGYIITIFLLLASVTYFFIGPLDDSNKLVIFIKKYFLYIMLLPILLLFTSIIIRVREYGMTESRYIIILIGVALTVSIAYVTIAKVKRFDRVLIGISILLIFASFGPWGIINLCITNQIQRLENNLEKLGILNNGVITLATSKISFKDSRDISSSIDYILNHDKLELIAPWFKEKNLPKNTKKILAYIGCDYTPYWRTTPSVITKKFQVANEGIIQIKAYDYFLYNYLSTQNPITNLTLEGQQVTIKLSDNHLILDISGKEKIIFDLNDKIAELLQSLETQTAYSYVVDIEKMTLIETQGSYKARLILEDLNIEIQDKDSRIIQSLRFNLSIAFN